MKTRYTPEETRSILEALVSQTFQDPLIAPPSRLGHIIQTYHAQHGSQSDPVLSSRILGDLLQVYEPRAFVRSSASCSSSPDSVEVAERERKNPGGTEETRVH